MQKEMDVGLLDKETRRARETAGFASPCPTLSCKYCDLSALSPKPGKPGNSIFRVQRYLFGPLAWDPFNGLFGVCNSPLHPFIQEFL